ncbi:MAG: hypothetical protein V2A53_05410 [bacterium]
MSYTYKEGTFEFWVRIERNPTWLKDRVGRRFFDGPIGDAKLQVSKTPDMKLYVEHYHPVSYIRTLSHDISLLDPEKDHYVVITWTPAELILYIDGGLVAKIEDRMMASAM